MVNLIYELDNLDKKILYYLDHNSRQSSSAIAKKCHVHKNVVNFRINRLVKNGIIRQFVAMISPTTLGLTPYKFYLQLQNLTDEKEKEIAEFIKTLPVYWSARVSGRWDLIIGVLVRNLNELADIKKNILNRFGEDITNKSFSILVEAPHFYRKYLLGKNEDSTKFWIKSANQQKIDELDSKILKILSHNSRAPIIEISEKTGVTAKTIISRIKTLEKKQIIYDYRISLNLEKMGYCFFKCFISLKKADKEEIKNFIKYCKNHKNIIHITECMGDWDLEPEFEIESYEKFQESLSEIRNKFSRIIKNIETVNILKENSYVCIPR